MQPIAGQLGGYIAGALAVTPAPRADGRRLALVPLIADDAVAVVDLQSGAVRGTVKTGIAPFGVVVNSGGTVAWVSNWGGRVPLEGEPSAPTGETTGADRVVVDTRGVAASGTVARIDLEAMRVTETIEVGTHPTALAWDEPRERLYVALGNDDAVAEVDTRRRAVAGRIEIRPFGRDINGMAPTALALASDGSRLYVACGGINAIAVINTADRSLAGLIPTAWYPDSLALSPDGRMLAVGALLGAGSGWRRPSTLSFSLRTPIPSRRYVHANRGSISVMPVPAERDLANDTLAVAENNHMPLVVSGGRPATPGRQVATAGDASSARAAAARPLPAKPTAVPLAAGDPSLIEHVVYIIKENRTYDQVLGDLPQGNGDPTYVLFGEDIAPNQRRLAREFVLLDNLYATGGNSGDGHQWVTQANEADYAMWPGYTGRSYPFDGADPLAYAPGGFIWDGARAKKKTVRVYGEFVPAERSVSSNERASLLQEWEKGADFSNRWKPTPRVQGLMDSVAPDFPAFSLAIPDVIRADLFVRDVRTLGAGRRHAQSGDGAAAGQPHLRHVARSLDAAGHGRRQRPRARPRGRCPLAQPLLAAHGDLHRRRRCAGRGGSRGRAPDRRAGGEPVRAPPPRGLDVLLAPQHPEDHRVDPRAAAAFDLRPYRQRHAGQLQRRARSHAVYRRRSQAVAPRRESCHQRIEGCGTRRGSCVGADAVRRA